MTQSALFPTSGGSSELKEFKAVNKIQPLNVAAQSFEDGSDSLKDDLGNDYNY